jgi:ubiquinone/menaquinone biosynthesis C-methylase UbiE
MKAILQRVSFRGKNILEIGCGDGRLTFEYARLVEKVVGIDPDISQIKRARKEVPKGLTGKVKFQVGKGEELDFPDNSFDIVFFSWSLCCIDSPMMERALSQAWRVLKKNRILVNLQGSLQQPFEKGSIYHMITGKFPESFEDVGFTQARYALKYATIAERKFRLIAEEEFPVNTYYDTVQDFLDGLNSETWEEYNRLDEDRKKEIRSKLSLMRSRKGILLRENAVLSVLRKVA